MDDQKGQRAVLNTAVPAQFIGVFLSLVQFVQFFSKLPIEFSFL